jgi:predicted nucleic acid-binding protein
VACKSLHEAGAAGGLLPTDAWAGLHVVTLTPDETALAADLSPRLGAGERTCLAVAVHRQGLFASDGLDARRAARSHDVPRTGTIGILVLGVRRGDLARDRANVLLSDMIAHGYRSPVDRIDDLLDEP